MLRAGKRRPPLGAALSSRPYVPTASKSVARSKVRPASQDKTGVSVAIGTRSGALRAPSLDTEVSTQRVETGDRHNSTAKRLRALTPRAEWLAEVKQATTVVREQSARKLEARGKALARDRRRLWRVSGLAARAERTERALESVAYEQRDRSAASSSDPEAVREAVAYREQEYSKAWRAWKQAGGAGSFTPPELDELTRLHSPELVGSRWHVSRAQNQREIFERVDRCGTTEGARITLVCRGCKEATEIEVGCGSSWFCADCRKRAVAKFRTGFEANRLGLVTTAARAGLMRRNQPKGDRWGERLLTVTLPPRGSAQERIEVLQATWARFWRKLRDRLRPELQGSSGITIEDVARGFPLKVEGDELKLFDLLSYLHVFEWTPGADGHGHPHMHVWLFSRFIEQRLVRRLWEAAYVHVLRARREAGGWSGPIEEPAALIVDIRKAGGDVSHELVKYLTKDWEVCDGTARRAAPEVFAEVYATLAGKRRRQSSSGLSMWAVEKFCACPACGFERERGHWARVDIEHALDEHRVERALGIPHPIGFIWDPEAQRYRLAPLTAAADYELRSQFDAQRDSDWLDSFERRIVRATMAKHLGTEGD